MSYISSNDLPIKVSEVLKSRIKSIRQNHCQVPGHQSFRIEFINGVGFSLVKGWSIFGFYEIAIFIKGKMQETKGGDTIERTDNPQEVLTFMLSASSL